jgi:phosphoribosyl 1,2-cyclic phosphodiesterase
VIVTFLGTRGNIKIRSKLHYRHTSTLITFRRKTIMIDCGLDWTRQVKKIHPDAIIITHAHEDHAAGLRYGAPCPVWATRESWQHLKRYKIEQRNVIRPRQPTIISGITVQAFAVAHAINAPAVGYRITAGNKTLFYVPDLVKIKQQKEALHNIDLYIGDGALLRRTLLVRKKDGTFIGHSPVSAQLSWCKKEGVKKIIITHCGTEIVSQDHAIIEQQFKALGKEFGVHVRCAYDGLQIKV